MMVGRGFAALRAQNAVIDSRARWLENGSQQVVQLIEKEFHHVDQA